MSNTVLAWINYADLATTTFIASSSTANMPPQNLLIDQGSPSTAWQTAAGAVSGVTLRITPAAPGQTWRAFGLFRTNLTSAATITFALYTNPSTLVWSAAVAGPVAGYRQAVSVAPVDTPADYALITINDATNPDTFLNVPLAFAGPIWQPLTGPSFATTFGRDDQTDEAVSRGGQEYPINRWQRRRWNIALDGVRGSEAWTDVDALDAVARTASNVLFIPDTTSATVQREAIFGRLKATGDVTYPYGSADRRAWRATVTERI